MTVTECWEGEGCKYLHEGEPVVTLQCLECIFLAILHIAIRLAGLAVFIMLIIGGFKYLTAAGDPKSAQAAKNTITYAIFGLVLILFAWFILYFIEYFTGVKVTEFTIPSP